jgi:hypothetical protein
MPPQPPSYQPAVTDHGDLVSGVRQYAPRVQRPERSAGFQTCCVADFQVGAALTAQTRSERRGVCRLEALRYNRFGNLRYDFVKDPGFGSHPSAIWCKVFQMLLLYWTATDAE